MHGHIKGAARAVYAILPCGHIALWFWIEPQESFLMHSHMYYSSQSPNNKQVLMKQASSEVQRHDWLKFKQALGLTSYTKKAIFNEIQMKKTTICSKIATALAISAVANTEHTPAVYQQNIPESMA